MPASSTSSVRRAVVVGAGPNGLTTAALLARAGWQVEVFERNHTIGGGASSSSVLGEGTIVDTGSAGHPFGAASPVFKDLQLENHGLQWLHSTYPMAHPLPGQPAALLHRNMSKTAAALGVDAAPWKILHRGLVRDTAKNLENILGPMLRIPAHPLRMAKFGLVGSTPSSLFARTAFRTEAARALFIGSAAHAITPLDHPLTSGYGSVFGALGMTVGWPVAAGGSQAISDALASVLSSHGGVIHTDVDVRNLDELPDADALILSLTPAQVLRLTGKKAQRIADSVRSRFRRWRYGPGAFKIDYLLDRPIEWEDEQVGLATTVHVGGTAREIRLAEAQVNAGAMPHRPFVLLCQQQVADPSRVSGEAAGKTVVWAYTHVPNGYIEPHPGYVAGLIEAQIERFAPGFRNTIVKRHQTSPAQFEAWNPNLVGGDIAGGAMTGSQSILRPGLTLEPYRLAESGMYLCSAATPPGAGVHGMPGYWAARAVTGEDSI